MSETKFPELELSSHKSRHFLDNSLGLIPLAFTFLFVALFSAATPAFARPAYFDRTFESEVFTGPRRYRIFLPLNYESDEQRYPVIYYFHGHSDRYTLEHYKVDKNDDGKETVQKIAKFVSMQGVIVVAVDGYVKEHYEDFYGGSPWDIRKEGGDYDFGVYFQEMVAHVDLTYRTLASRRYRATSGLSMGGFTSLLLSARYPQLIGSASAFNPGPEFFTGDKGSRVLWRPKDHVMCHGHTMVRLIRASGDFISQYHEETRSAYSRAHEVDFEYRQDEFHCHWATSIEETFLFHQRAFGTAKLDQRSTRFSYASAYRHFGVWWYEVQVEDEGNGLVYLTDVETNSLQVTTRAWAPDGLAADMKISLKTASLYQPGQTYHVSDLSFATGKTRWTEAKADAEGRIDLQIDGSGHYFGINGPGVTPPQIVLLPITTADRLRLRPGKSLSLPLRVYNPANQPARKIALNLSSKYPTVEWLGRTMAVAELGPGEIAESGDSIQVRLVAGAGDFAPTRLDADLSATDQPRQTLPIDVLVIPEQIPSPAEIEILDGRMVTFSVFRQQGNQGGGKAISRTVTEGRGNGDGVLQPGEEATLWIRIPQGLDPRDKNNWHRTKIYSDSPWLVECQDIQEQKQREWTSAMDRTSVVRLAKDVPSGTRIPLLLDNETWSFHFTPDVRYGHELLYQAFQYHKHHLHQIELTVAKKGSQLVD